MEQEILARLDALAAKVGVAAEHLWGVLVTQQVLRLVDFGAAQGRAT